MITAKTTVADNLVGPLFKFSACKIVVGSYGAGVVLFSVPSQQYRSKHVLQASGIVVPAFSKLRESIAQPTHVGHVLSTELLPMAATS